MNMSISNYSTNVTDIIIEIEDIRNCLIVIACFLALMCYGLVCLMNLYLDLEVKWSNKISKLETTMEDKLIIKAKEIGKMNEKIRYLEKYIYDLEKIRVSLNQDVYDDVNLRINVR